MPEMPTPAGSIAVPLRTPSDATRALHDALLERRVQGPNASRMDAIARVHARIRSILGPDYDVAIHGSYATGTALATGTRLDLAAIRATGDGAPQQFGELYFDVSQRLERTEYRERVIERTNDLWLPGEVEVSLTPALGHRLPGTDHVAEPLYVRPIETRFRRLHPRLHAERFRARDTAIDGRLGRVVRLLKLWTREQHLHQSASGFYLECAAYNAPETLFGRSLVEGFVGTMEWLGSLDPETEIIATPAGDKEIFLPIEWSAEQFELWRARLRSSLDRLDAVFAASDQDAALQAWSDLFIAGRDV